MGSTPIRWALSDVTNDLNLVCNIISNTLSPSPPPPLPSFLFPVFYLRFPKYTVGFYGSVDHGHRAKMLDRLQFLLEASKTTYRLGPSKTWVEDM